ncbi:hypothetical protein H6CHR_03430 [Variovorax sp. PBL-H6]|uniref:hypothetical protein n=1 Tax=Variovorax sp. PBL-H6 TaxID=434009 RepID=UPI0013179F5D|nr:hypothetical protein [Variovorax sp. PBL-H6]VTU30591.1 hypothetical protein H6CHR_03430 [Variovorax sp. PBL-H6]
MKLFVASLAVALAGLSHAGTPGSESPEGQAPAVVGDIVDASGKIKASAYRDLAYKFGQDAGMAYRFGPPASKSGVPTLPLREDLGAISHCGGSPGCKTHYQLGKESSKADNPYVSTHGVAIGTPDAPNSVAGSVAWFQAQATDRETWMQRPQLLWQDRSLSPPALRDYFSHGALSPNSAASLPIAETRGEGGADGPSTRMSLVATQGSPTEGATIYTVGTYTAQQRAFVRLPAGKVPTALAVTPMSEFALATIWDTVALKGQVAVIALGGVPMNRTWQRKDDWYDWWHDWMDGSKPGFPNQGGIGFMKVVGYVDLPANVTAPTAIKVTTGIDPVAMIVHPVGKEISSIGALGSPLAGNRAKFLPGGEFYERYAKGGVAVVTSQSERTAAFVDLGPLFRHFNSMYLDTAEKNAQTQKLGMSAGEWPYPLAPGAVPVVAKVIKVPGTPVAVETTATLGYWSKDERERVPGTPYWRATPRSARAWIATREGELHIYSLGGYAAGPKPTTPKPAEIAPVGRVTGLGRNITWLAKSKGFPGRRDTANDSVLFTARGDRAWGWVGFGDDQNGGSVIRRMADSRVDPIMVTEADQYSTSGGVVTVADYTGKAIRNYRFSSVVYPRNSSQTSFCPQDKGGCPTLTPEGEYAGSLDLPFRPFSVHSSNAP